MRERQRRHRHDVVGELRDRVVVGDGRVDLVVAIVVESGVNGEREHLGCRAAGRAGPLLGVHAAVGVTAGDARPAVDCERRGALDEAVLGGDHQRSHAVLVDVVHVQTEATEATDEYLDADIITALGAQQ